MRFYLLRKLGAASICSLLVFHSTYTFAADEVFQTSSNGKTYTCGRISSVWHGGIMKKGAFASYTQLISDTKKKIAAATGTKKDKLRAKLATYKQHKKTVGQICTEAASNNPSPTPTPSSTPGGSRYFDSAGNVTTLGKAVFKIPSNLSANVSAGKIVYEAECNVCHDSEERNRSYTTLESLVPNDPMFVNITSQQLADVTAYLSRFRF